MLVFDNFYNNPLEVKQTALTCSYMPVKTDDIHKFGTAPWPGKMSKISYSPNDLDLYVSKILNKPVRELKGINSGRFRISSANDKSSNDIHIDTCDYAGVLYLNDTSNIAGTIFYTNKSTGKNSCDIDFYKTLVLNNDINDLTKWNINLVSYIVFNRLIIYPANMFHGIGPLFGVDNNDSRLVQTFFWETL
jgi:hypothetical protein